MTASVRYLLARAGAFPIAIPADRMRHIWSEGTPTAEVFDGVDSLDLRSLLGHATEHGGITVAFETEAETKFLILDAIGTFVTLSADEFAALPEVFAFARQFFDAACRRRLDGGYPLRLRLSSQNEAD